jgi:hypothetical protein
MARTQASSRCPGTTLASRRSNATPASAHGRTCPTSTTWLEKQRAGRAPPARASACRTAPLQSLTSSGGRCPSASRRERAQSMQPAAGRRRGPTLSRRRRSSGAPGTARAPLTRRRPARGLTAPRCPLPPGALLDQGVACAQHDRAAPRGRLVVLSEGACPCASAVGGHVPPARPGAVCREAARQVGAGLLAFKAKCSQHWVRALKARAALRRCHLQRRSMRPPRPAQPTAAAAGRHRCHARPAPCVTRPSQERPRQEAGQLGIGRRRLRAPVTAATTRTHACRRHRRRPRTHPRTGPLHRQGRQPLDTPQQLRAHPHPRTHPPTHPPARPPTHPPTHRHAELAGPELPRVPPSERNDELMLGLRELTRLTSLTRLSLKAHDDVSTPLHMNIGFLAGMVGPRAPRRHAQGRAAWRSAARRASVHADGRLCAASGAPAPCPPPACPSTGPHQAP